jgi:hypothetical protein
MLFMLFLSNVPQNMNYSAPPHSSVSDILLFPISGIESLY